MDIKEAYEKSLQKIKENNIKNLKEYTKLAKEENLLSATSLEYISRKEFNNLLKEIKNDKNIYKQMYWNIPDFFPT